MDSIDSVRPRFAKIASHRARPRLPVSLRCSCSFFVSFLYIGVYLFLNLYVAAIIDNFSSISGNDDGSNQAHPMRPSRHSQIAGCRFEARPARSASMGFHGADSLRNPLTATGGQRHTRSQRNRVGLRAVRSQTGGTAYRLSLPLTHWR